MLYKSYLNMYLSVVLALSLCFLKIFLFFFVERVICGITDYYLLGWGFSLTGFLLLEDIWLLPVLLLTVFTPLYLPVTVLGRVLRQCLLVCSTI